MKINQISFIRLEGNSMLTRTTVAGINALICIANSDRDRPVPPREIAEKIDASASYMAKIAGLLVKADIARSHRGTQGGITLARRPSDIALLEIVEACQGKVLANYCDDAPNIDDVCSFHRAMIELHDATLKVLSRWTLADLAERPHPTGTLLGIDACRMKGVPAPDGDVAS